jgi:hypothetical protein
MSCEEKGESEENAESDECEGEAKGSDPGAWKTRINHFCLNQKKKQQHLLIQYPDIRIMYMKN